MNLSKLLIIYFLNFLSSNGFSQQFFIEIKDSDSLDSKKIPYAYLDTIRFAGADSDSSLYFWKSRALFRLATQGCFGTLNTGIDTFQYKERIYLEVNPFPDIYLELDTIWNDTIEKEGVFKIQVKGNFHREHYPNGNIKSCCVLNNVYGSVKCFFDKKGRLIKKGAFRLNKKNGKWIEYKKNGKIKRVQLFKNGLEID